MGRKALGRHLGKGRGGVFCNVAGFGMPGGTRLRRGRPRVKRGVTQTGANTSVAGNDSVWQR
jgi:hypothetical protein